MTTRSTVLCKGRYSSFAWVHLGQPPTGWCWIIKTISITNDNPAAGSVQIRLSTPGQPAYVDIVRLNLQPNSGINNQLWVMCMATDTMDWLPSQAGVAVWISGTELEMPTGLPGTLPAPPVPSWPLP